MVVAARAVHGQSEEHPAGRGDHVVQVGVPVLWVVLLAEQHPRTDPQHARSDQRFETRVLDLVPGELLVYEPVVRFVFVECCNHVVAVAPSVGLIVVVLVSRRVCVAHRVKPVPSPPLAISGRFEQVIDERGERFLGGIFGKRVHDIWRGQQPHQVQIRPSHERLRIRARSCGDTLARLPVQNERIDRMLR